MRAIYTMLRVPNLLIIAVTFFILRFLIFIPIYSAYSAKPGMGEAEYMIMVIITMCIAAAGYIINDYFDVATDRVNRPKQQIIGKQITSGQARTTALLFSLLVVFASIGLSIAMHDWLPASLLILALAVAWWYAVHLKRTFLWGNIAVSCMSAGTLAMAWLIESHYSTINVEGSGIITNIVTAISIFAFLLSLKREIVKDIEDMEGDKMIRCQSLPLVKGVPFTKTILLILASITFILLVAAQIYLFHFGRNVALVWLLIAVQIPLAFFAIKLTKAETKTDFHFLSSMLKWIMVGGIGSVIAGQF
jgi:4-hydroxybenzoate polyprenyltransferase